MRAAASMNKDFLFQKRKASTGVAHVQSNQDEQTTSSLVFKRKRLETAPPTEHSHSDGRAPNQEIITIQECEAKSSQRKSLLDPNFDILAHDESFFFPGEDKARLMAHDEDHLCHDVEKLLGQAFALTCLANVKVKDRKRAEE